MLGERCGDGILLEFWKFVEFLFIFSSKFMQEKLYKSEQGIGKKYMPKTALLSQNFLFFFFSVNWIGLNPNLNERVILLASPFGLSNCSMSFPLEISVDCPLIWRQKSKQGQPSTWR